MTFEVLEDRALPASLLHTLYPDAIGPQHYSQFGIAVAADTTFHVVGAPSATVAGIGGAGQVFVYDAATDNLVATLNNPNPSTTDRFGAAVAVSGNLVVVGASQEDVGVTDSGAAYVFNATTGGLIAVLNNPTPNLNDRFGNAVAVSGNIVVVGAYLDNTTAVDSGSAYLFNATTGALLGTIDNPTPGGADYFGYSVAISGSQVVVAANQDNGAASYNGIAYVFDATNITLIATLNNPTPGIGGDLFGTSVAISGNNVVVGAYHDDTFATDAGEAYVFNASSGALVATLACPTPDSTDYFGYSVSIWGDTVVVGSYQRDVGATEFAGAAFVFSASSGGLISTLTKPIPASQDRFGYAVAVAGGTAIVGAYQDDLGEVDAGAAYAFDANDGELIAIPVNATPAVEDNFGWGLAMSANSIVVGAPGDDTGANWTGAAYVFSAATGALSFKLANPTPGFIDNFGKSVATSGNLIVVGAFTDDTVAQDAGAAYLFDATTGSLIAVLTSPAQEANEYFGLSVAISENAIVVGAPRDDTGATNAGAVYVFSLSGVHLATLHDPTPETDGNFGSVVAVYGSMIVVGDQNSDVGAANSGSAFLYDAANGAFLGTLNNPSPASSDLFGCSVAIAGNSVVVGALDDDAGAANSGIAYVFDATSRNLLATLNNPTPAAQDEFGYTVAVSGNRVLVGAMQDDTGASDAGSAYVFNASTGAVVATLNNPTPASGDAFGGYVAIVGDIVVVTAAFDNTQNLYQGAAYVFSVDPVIPVQIGPVAPNPRNTTVSSADIILSGPVNLSTFTSTDLTLTRDGGANLLTPAQAVSWVSGNTYRVSGLAALTNLPGEYLLTTNLSAVNDPWGNSCQGSASNTWLMDTTAPVIAAVYFDGSSWNAAFRQAAGNSDYGIPAQGGTSQLTSLPWSNINTFYVKFSENVNVDSGDLGVRGINVANYAISSFVYDNVNFVAKWVLSGAIDTDRLILDLDGDSANAVTDTAGNSFAGTWTEGVSTFPTTGAAGNDFKYRFVVAVGDADRTGHVRNPDINLVRANLFVDAGQSGYNIYADIDGNGQTRNADVNAVRSHLFIDPPAGPGPNRPVRGGGAGIREQHAIQSSNRYVASRFADQDRTGTTLRRMPVRAMVEVLDRLFEEL